MRKIPEKQRLEDYNYDLDSIIKTFEKGSNEYDQWFKDNLQTRYACDAFNHMRALLEMVKEIKKLKVSNEN